MVALLSGSCGVLSHLEDICNCHPLPDETDYRHAAKHVPIPGGTPALITVNDILSWQQTPILPPTQPRFGRELQLVQIQLAYLENASVNPSDCDVHLEISQTADLHAPRVIIETLSTTNIARAGKIFSRIWGNRDSSWTWNMAEICHDLFRSAS